jgi:hypothetical protein
MRAMKKKHLARLEARLERLVEGSFSHLFGKQIRAQDIARRLARAMTEGTHAVPNSNVRLAPDRYLIYTHPDIQRFILEHHAGLTADLSDHLVQLADDLGYQLARVPEIKLLADVKLPVGRVEVVAAHSQPSTRSTAALERIQMPTVETPRALLIIDGSRTVHLEHNIVNVGRARTNNIVLDDPYVSRHHIQLRQREGAYLLFDVDSQSGAYVNDVRVKEHRLRSGDLIQVGQTRILYLHDEEGDGDASDHTEPIEPVE